MGNTAINTAMQQSALEQEKKAQEETKSLIELNREKRAAEQAARIAANQPNINQYFMRLNGRLTRDDLGSITGGFVSKDDYAKYMADAQAYASTQQKPDLSNLAQFQQTMFDRQEARNELDKLNEQRRIDRERLGQGIGEFTAMLGDIAKSHGGALVTPRSIDQQLAQLSERERNAYKLYTANQQRIDEDRLKALKDAQDRKDLADWRDKQLQNKLDLQDKKHQDKLDEIEARGKLADAKAKEIGSDGLNIGGQIYLWEKGLTTAILGTAKDYILSEKEVNADMKEDIKLIMQQYQNQYPGVKGEAIAVNYFLSKYWDVFSRDTKIKFFNLAYESLKHTPISDKPETKNDVIKGSKASKESVDNTNWSLLAKSKETENNKKDNTFWGVPPVKQ